MQYSIQKAISFYFVCMTFEFPKKASECVVISTYLNENERSKLVFVMKKSFETLNLIFWRVCLSVVLLFFFLINKIVKMVNQKTLTFFLEV